MTKKKTKTRKRTTPRWDEVFEDHSSSKFEIDPRTTILKLACCDCGSTHSLDMDVVKGKLKIHIVKDADSAKILRRSNNYDYKRRRQ